MIVRKVVQVSQIVTQTSQIAIQATQIATQADQTVTQATHLVTQADQTATQATHSVAQADQTATQATHSVAQADQTATQADHIVIQATHIVTQANHTADHIVNHSANSNMDKYYKSKEKVNGYSILKIIGEGRYGIVYLAIDDKYQKCVIKQLKTEMLEETRKKLFYEEQILQELNNPKFPKFISKFKDEYREGYILEYIEGRVFEDLLVRDRYKFSKAEIYKIGSQLLEMVELLHNNNIVHRDIRLPNVILKENKELALIDFGLARIIDNKKYVKKMDYWFLGDFLIHLYYSSYKGTDSEEKPWYEELDLNSEEEIFLKKLMGIEGSYQNIEDIKNQLEKIKSIN